MIRVDRDYKRAEERDVLLPVGDGLADAIRVALPKGEDLHRQVMLSIGATVDHVEFVATRSKGPDLRLATEDGKPGSHGFKPFRLYGKATINGEVIAASGGKFGPWEIGPATKQSIRYEFLKLAREIGYVIARDVELFRAAGGHHGVVTVRPRSSLLMKPLSRYGDREAVILQDYACDELIVLYAAYYFVAPPGEEWVPTDNNPEI